MAGRKTNRSEVETELKMKLSPEDLEKVFRALSRKIGISNVSHKFLPRYYYDTANLDLYQHKMSARVQYKPGKGGKCGCYEQTVKIEFASSVPLAKGALRRKECKNDLSSCKPDLSGVTDADARKAVRPFLRKRLVHIFTAAIERRFFDLKIKDGKKKGLVEVAFDVGQLILPQSNRYRDFFEIEVEVKQGSSDLIDIVKNEILRIAPAAKIQRLSKADQGSRFHLKGRK